MNTQIHSSSIIEDGAQIGQNVRIGPFCHVGPHVKLGDNIILHSHVVIAGHTTIGEGTQIFPFASLGHAPQDLKFKGEKSELIIGKNNMIREYVTMNPGTEGGGLKTIIGDNGLFMTGSHVAHDCIVGNNVILVNNATLGGHVVLGDYAFMGGLSAAHQFVRIGAHAIVGGVVAIDTDLIPYGRAKGERASLSGLNIIGLERRGFTKNQIKLLQRVYNELFSDNGTLEERIDGLEKKYNNEPLVMDVINFARGRTRFPLCAPPR